MWSMWNAPSDRDYYDPHGLGDREIEDDGYPWDDLTADDYSLMMTDPGEKGDR